MSEANPESTAAGSAGSVPQDASSGQAPDSDRRGFPGAFPETPANETTGFSVNPIPATPGTGNPINLAPGEKVPDPSTLTSNTISSTVRDDASLAKKTDDSEQTFGVSPLPATSGAGNPVQLEPGEKVPDPSTLTSNTISSTARDDTSLAKKADDSGQTFGVSPLPATSGIGNPVQLEPGEKVPPSSSFTQNTLNTFVTTDKESYERGSGPPQLPEVVTPQKERDNRGTSLFDLPPVSGAMIPESSLPIFGAPNEEQDPGFTIQSVGPNSTTVALAGQVPLEPRGVPTVIPQDEGSSNQQRDLALRDQTSGPNQSTSPSASEVPSTSRANETPSKSQDPNIFIQSVGPSSSTAKLAGEVPLESGSSSRDLPESRPGDATLGGNRSDDVTIQSVGPESTTAGLAGKVPFESNSSPSGGLEDQPRSEGQGGERSGDVTIQSVGPGATTAGLAGNVPLEPREPSRGASRTPQHLDNQEGSKPGDVTIQSVGANATTADLAGKVPLEPRSSSKGISENQQQPDEQERGRSDDVTIQSVGPNATTAGLAGNVPLESRSPPGNTSEGHRTGDDTPGGGPGNAFIQSTGANATTAGLAGNVPLEPRSSSGNLSEGRRTENDTQGGGSGNAFIQSTGANATTAGLAGNVPLEPRGVPEIVQESQQTAGFAPEASANPEALKEKAALEEELESKVPREPAASEGIGSATAGKTPSAETTNTGSTSRGLPPSVLQSIDEINRGSTKGPTSDAAASDSVSGGSQGIAIAPTVPDVVQESITKSHQSPEAAASAAVVDEKKAVESELLKVVKPEEALGEPAPSASAALSETAPAPTASANIGQVGNTGVTAADSNPGVSAKSAAERAIPNRHDSRDISPMSHPVEGLQRGSQPIPQLTPEVGPKAARSTTTPGGASSSASAGVTPSSTPQKSRVEPVRGSSGANSPQATSEASASSDKKSKRASGFFGKLKSKFSHKD